MMAAGQYDPNQGYMTQEQYQQQLMMQQMHGEYGQEIDAEYGQEIEGHYVMEDKPQEDPIQEKIQKIIQICEENDALFGDQEFPDNDQSLYNDPANPPDYAENNPIVEWRRPQEFIDRNIHDVEPKMYRDKMSPGDIRQGALPDCWFLGALLVLSTNPELLNNLIYFDGIKYGFAVF